MELTKCIVAEFIECYKNNPTLWDFNYEHYQHKERKKRSYQELLKVYRKLNPTATVLDVKKKINTLRSSYRRELRKVRESEREQEVDQEEAGDELVYQPKVWWFELMHFIGSMTTDELGMECDTSSSVTSIQIQKAGAPTETDSDSRETNEDVGVKYEYYEDEEWLHPPKSKKQCQQKSPTPTSSVAFNSAVSATPTATPTSRPTQVDLFDQIAKTWASKLRSLPHAQRLTTERAINEILFEAEMAALQNSPIKMQNAVTTATQKATKTNGAAAIKFEPKPPSKLKSFFESI